MPQALMVVFRLEVEATELLEVLAESLIRLEALVLSGLPIRAAPQRGREEAVGVVRRVPSRVEQVVCMVVQAVEQQAALVLRAVSEHKVWQLLHMLH